MQLAVERKDLESISKAYHLNNIMLFGSVLTDSFHENSDIDIAVIGEQVLSLDELLELELYFEKKFDRMIDVIDLKNSSLDIFLKINILNTGKCIYTNDDNKSLEQLVEVTERYYRENETFFFFRRRDLLS